MAVMPAIVPGPPSATAFALAAVSSAKPRDDLLQDLLLVAKMLVGRGGRDPGTAAGVGQGEAVGPMLDQQFARRGDQRLAQVAVVEPLLWAHRGAFLCLGHRIFFPRRSADGYIS